MEIRSYNPPRLSVMAYLIIAVTSLHCLLNLNFAVNAAPVTLNQSLPINISQYPEDPVEPSYFFQRDILGLEADAFTSGCSLELNGVTNEQLRWPNAVIPYRFSRSFEAKEAMEYKQYILDAMKGFDQTCVKFVPWTNEKDVILISSARTCSSYVGKESGMQPVIVSIGACLDEPGKVQHELMHAIGFYHEQGRLDRDQYVDINWPNIAKIDQPQFVTYDNTTAFGQPYDFGSVLHYGMFDFAIDENVWTIRPKPQYSGEQIGQRRWLSDLDIKKINLMYKCDERGAAGTTTATPSAFANPEGVTAASVNPVETSSTTLLATTTTVKPSNGPIFDMPHRGCFFPIWSPDQPYSGTFAISDIDVSLCTYIVLPYQNTNDGALIPNDGDAVLASVGTLIKLQLFSKISLNLFLSIGGKGSNKLAEMGNNETTRTAFVSTIVTKLHKWGFDGLDVNFDEKFTDRFDSGFMPVLLKSLRTAFEMDAASSGTARLALSATVHYTPMTVDYRAPKLNQLVDLVNVVAYDLGTTVTDRKIVSHHSPFRKGPFGQSTDENLVSLMNTLSSLGIAKSKLVAGIPFYGRGWLLDNVDLHDLGAPAFERVFPGNHSTEPGVWSYDEICQQVLSDPKAANIHDNDTGSAYAYTDVWWFGYDDEPTVRAKAKWIRDNGFGGVFVNDISEDDSRNLCHLGRNPLLTAVKQSLQQETTNS